MLHDRRKRYGKRSSEVTHRNVLAAIELREQRAARRIGKRGKGTVEGLLILNHMVKCRRGGPLCQWGEVLAKQIATSSRSTLRT